MTLRAITTRTRSSSSGRTTTLKRGARSSAICAPVLWGVGTPRGVKVGDSEKALLTEYPEALYCIAADESELYDGYSDEGGYSEPAYDFDRAYVWQPQTPQDDGNYDVRDIAFYLKDGTVSAITMTKPYAFRFAYGVDRDAALRLAEENRSALCGQ